MNKQQREFYKIFAEHGSGDAKVTITAKELILLLHICYVDLYNQRSSWMEDDFWVLAEKGLYQTSYGEIIALPEKTEDECFNLMESCGVLDANNIIFLYMKNLSDLYRRRFKYHFILKNQPFPSTEQIGPRSLLEYGNCEDGLLADWLEWRKWIYDIDNRSAQETGYVFEPILSSCLGGESVSATYSPVKRIDERGKKTSNGRQIDCYLKEKKEVYELKMRVTIAASGQGRFKEEMSFPYEAHCAGLKPILVVFDDNISPLLASLKAQYEKYNGQVFIGKDAWNLLEERAGKEMSIFISKYIFPPVNAMDNLMHSSPHNIALERNENKIIIKNHNAEYVIERNEE